MLTIESSPYRIQEPDVRALIRLLGEVSVMEADLPRKKFRLLNEVSRLIDADGWAWSLTRQTKPHANVEQLDGMSGGDAKALPLPSGLFASSENPKLSSYQISGDTVSVITFLRRAGREPFAPREEKISRVLCEEIPWLHERYAPSPLPMPEKKLPPRQAATLALLVKGVSLPAIATRLRISPHTVHGYIKDIYRHFGIHSRAGLINQVATRRK